MAYKNKFQDSNSKATSTTKNKRMEIKSFCYWGIVCLLALLTTGCNTPTRPSTDLSSPENTVKSYWAIKKQEIKERLEMRADSMSLELYDEQARRTKEAETEAALKEWRNPIQNTIESVSLETQTRAIVYTLEAYTTSARREKHKYILTKIDGEWYIENALTECHTCHGTGQEIDYASGLQPDGTWKKQKVCETCKGRGFTSDIYGE